jgi:uncharacterized membrane protein
MTARAHSWHPAGWWRALRARPRLLASLGLGVAVWYLLPGFRAVSEQARALVCWNAMSLTYLVLAAPMILKKDTPRMHRRALLQDEGRLAILLLVVLATAAVLLAVGSQLAAVRDMKDLDLRTGHILLAALTVLSAWLFTHLLFAQHYAHDFWVARLRKEPDPLIFPGTPDPGYLDFVYFACVIGTSGQTADVVFNGGALRGVGTLHCVLAFFFNAILIALTINIAAGLM